MNDQDDGTVTMCDSRQLIKNNETDRNYNCFDAVPADTEYNYDMDNFPASHSLGLYMIAPGVDDAIRHWEIQKHLSP